MATKPRKSRTKDTPSLTQWEAAGLAPELNEREKAFRDQFVKEYLLDYSPYLACLRLGFASDFAKDWAQKFMGEPYVIKRIAELECAPPSADSEEADTLRNKQRVMANLWRESQYFGPGSSHAARVAATAKLASMFGMDAPVKTETKVTVETPVQFYLPDNGRDGGGHAE